LGNQRSEFLNQRYREIASASCEYNLAWHWA
jgi:hypothetical protein